MGLTSEASRGSTPDAYSPEYSGDDDPLGAHAVYTQLTPRSSAATDESEDDLDESGDPSEPDDADDLDEMDEMDDLDDSDGSAASDGDDAPGRPRKRTRAAAPPAAAVVVVNLRIPGCTFLWLPRAERAWGQTLHLASASAYNDKDMQDALVALGLRAPGRRGKSRYIPAKVVPDLPAVATRVYVLDCTDSLPADNGAPE